MDDTTARFWSDLVGRLTGPMTFRLVLQPTMAMVSAIHDGVKDAKAGEPPYFWSLLQDPARAAQQLLDGTKSVGRVLLLGVAMEVIYQWRVFGWVYPVELIVVVLLLAFVPYLLMRGPVNRIAKFRMLRRTRTPS
jgi:hypothetical protein